MIAIAMFRRLMARHTDGFGRSSCFGPCRRKMLPRAEQPFSNPTPSANAIALARELLALKGGNEMFDGMVDGVIESAKNSFLPSNPTLNRPLSEVTAQLRKEYEPKKAELFNEVARAYARHFTEAGTARIACILQDHARQKGSVQRIASRRRRLQARAGMDERIFRSGSQQDARGDEKEGLRSVTDAARRRRSFRHRGRLRRRARRAYRVGLRRARHGGGGISRRRHLRHPRLRAEEAAGLRVAISARI